MISRATLTFGWRFLLSGFGGVAVYLGYAPMSWWWAPIAGFAALGFAAFGQRARIAAVLGLAFGFAQFLPLLSWSNIYVGNLPWIALVTVQALLVAPAVALVALASWRLPAWPVWAAAAWVAGESLRDIFPFGGFPWGTVAFTQADGPLLPLAATIGAAGLSFAVALGGFSLTWLLHRIAQWRHTMRAGDPGRIGERVLGLVTPVALILAPLAGAGLSIPAVQDGHDAPTIPIALVQGNVPEPGLEFNARRRAVLDMHAAETSRLAQSIAQGDVPQPAWVLWPENASDIDPYRNADAAGVISDAAAAVGVPILVGAVVQAPEPGYVYNMGIVWDPVTGPGETYTKRRPVPFGEYMPWRGFFRIFSDKVDLITADFLPGKEPGNLTISSVAVGDVICFEIVEEDVVRDVVNGGATMIVVQTNNATFGYTNETYQQQAMSRVRAVEHGRSVLIAATSGVSAVIRPDGSVETSIPLFTAGFAVPEVPQVTATTPGTVLGAPVRWVLTLAGSIALLTMYLLSRRRDASDIEETTKPVVGGAPADES